MQGDADGPHHVPSTHACAQALRANCLNQWRKPSGFGRPYLSQPEMKSRMGSPAMCALITGRNSLVVSLLVVIEDFG